jgi:hypothetical protein
MFKDKKIIDTYNLFYGDKLVLSTISMIKQLFKRNFMIHIKDLMRHFGELSFILLIRSLKLILLNNIPIINLYGFTCYLKYERNIFFLSDNIQSPNSYFVNYYCENPPVYSTAKFKTIILENQSNNIKKIIEFINTLNLSNKENLKKASELLFELEPELQEELIELSVFSKMNNAGDDKFKNIKDLCFKLFNQNIIELNDMYISVHLIYEEKYRYILKTAKDADEWDYVDNYPDGGNIILDKLKEKDEEKVVETKYIEDNPFGYYGFISLGQKFKIKQTETSMLAEKGSMLLKEGKKEYDKRRIGTGAVCTDMVPSKKILDIIIKLKKKTDFFNIPETSKDVINRKSLTEVKKTLIDKAKYKENDLDNLNEEEMRMAYYWVATFSKDLICNNIQSFFEKNNILQYEK